MMKNGKSLKNIFFSLHFLKDFWNEKMHFEKIDEKRKTRSKILLFSSLFGGLLKRKNGVWKFWWKVKKIRSSFEDPCKKWKTKIFLSDFFIFHQNFQNIFFPFRNPSKNAKKKKDFWAIYSFFIKIFKIQFFPSEILQKEQKIDFWAIFSFFIKIFKIQFFPWEMLQKVKKMIFEQNFHFSSDFSKSIFSLLTHSVRGQMVCQIPVGRPFGRTFGRSTFWVCQKVCQFRPLADFLADLPNGLAGNLPNTPWQTIWQNFWQIH